MNAVRLAVGTLTIVPTSPPTEVDREVAGRAMVLAPFVAGVLVAAPLWVVSLLVDDRWSPALVAVLWVGGLAVLTRGLHLDGLADTADGLGSNTPPAAALEIMRKSDVGPFGVATLVLVLLAQVMATAQLLASVGAGAVATAVVLSRFTIPLVCRNAAARDGGLGAMVAGSVSDAQAALALGVTAATCGVFFALGELDLGVLAAGVAGPLVGLALCAWCVRRLGGITGDVIGACVETAFAGALLAMALV